MKRRNSALLLLFHLLVVSIMPALAGVPLASSKEDRHAKQALPPPGKALVYVYRQADGGPELSPPIWVRGRAAGPLAPNTFFMMAVTPGWLDVRAGGPGAATLSLRCQEGRIYFVHLDVSRSGHGKLVQASYGKGRQETQRGRLARESGARVVATTAAPGAARSGLNLILKGGVSSLVSNSQTLNLVLPTQIDLAATAGAYGLEGEWITAGGWAFGGEFMSHSHRFTATPGGSGEMAVTALMFNTKKYFRTDKTVQPYVGIGIGTMAASMSGAITGTATGVSAQVTGGAALRWGAFGLYPEIKYQGGKVKDASGVTVDASGSGLFVGVGYQF